MIAARALDALVRRWRPLARSQARRRARSRPARLDDYLAAADAAIVLAFHRARRARRRGVPWKSILFYEVRNELRAVDEAEQPLGYRRAYRRREPGPKRVDLDPSTEPGAAWGGFAAVDRRDEVATLLASVPGRLGGVRLAAVRPGPDVSSDGFFFVDGPHPKRAGDRRPSPGRRSATVMTISQLEAENARLRAVIADATMRLGQAESDRGEYAGTASAGLTGMGIATPEKGYLRDGGPRQFAADMMRAVAEVKRLRARAASLAGTCDAIVHQLAEGEASTGDRRDIRWCARTLAGALKAHAADTKPKGDKE